MNEKDAILILSQVDVFEYPFHEWLTGHKLILAIDTKVLEKYDKDQLSVLHSKYELIKPFSNYISNGDIEFWSLQSLTKLYNIKSVVIRSEIDVLRAARIRDGLGLSTNDYSSSLLFRDKFLMKQYASDQDLRVPWHKKVNTPSDLINLDFDSHYILKPTLSGGSMSVHLLKDQKDVSEVLASGLNTYFDHDYNYILEEFVELPVFHVDGVIINQNLEFAVASKYIGKCTDYQELRPHGSYTLKENDPRSEVLKSGVSQFIKGIDLSHDYVFHAEFFYNEKDNTFLLCEIACRMGGALIRETISLYKGVDLALCGTLANANLLKEIKYNDENEKQFLGWVVIPPRSGTIKKILNKCDLEFVKQFKSTRPIGEDIENATHSADQLMSFIFSGEDEKDLLINYEQILKWVDNHLEIVPAGDNL